jgi:hypothetical protein
MTTIATGLNSTWAASMTSCQGGLYYTNNFDPVKVWYGTSAALQDAGITGPTVVIGAPGTGAGGFSNGDHLVRYRYKNTKTGYVSNPSPAGTFTVSGSNGIFTFTVTASGGGGDIITSTDPKVDQIVIEATPVGGGTFYQAGTGINAAGNIVVGMNDDSLTQQFNSDAEYGSSEDLETYSSDVPPLCAIVVPYRGRMWYIGDQPFTLTGVTFTNGSPTVTGTGFNLRWAGKLITRTGDTASYEIASVASTISMTLSVNYGGVTAPGTATAQVIGKFPNNGYYTRLYYPEQCLLSRWARAFLAEDSDTVRAAVGRKDGLYVLGRYSGERLIFNADPAATEGGVISPLQGRRGCFNQRCLVDVEGEVYAWDRQGMWIVGEKPIHISRHIDRLLRQYIDFTEEDQFHANFEPINRVLKFFFVPEGEDAPTMRACFELDSGKWFFESSLQGITASCIVATVDGQVRLMLGDENGFSWYDGIESAFDGTPPSSASVVTVSSGATTTVIPVDETLPTVAPTLEGVMCYNPVTGEYEYIDSNTDTTITLGAAFSSAPTTGQELYLGPINFDYRTKWWVGEDQASRKNTTYLLIKLFPGSDTGLMRVYFYADFNTVPSSFTNWVGGTMPQGVSVPTNGQTYLEVSLSGGDDHRGVLAIPVPIAWNDALQARVTSIRPDGDLRILDIQFLAKGVASDVG